MAECHVVEVRLCLVDYLASKGVSECRFRLVLDQNNTGKQKNATSSSLLDKK